MNCDIAREQFIQNEDLTCPCVSEGAEPRECVGVKADFEAMESCAWRGVLEGAAAEFSAAVDGPTLST